MPDEKAGKVLANLQIKLIGEPSDIAKKYIAQIKKGVPVPEATRGVPGAGKWDFLLDALSKGDSLEMDKGEGDSFTNRARNMGFCIITRKIPDELIKNDEGEIIETIPKISMWFQGLVEKPPKQII